MIEFLLALLKNNERSNIVVRRFKRRKSELQRQEQATIPCDEPMIYKLSRPANQHSASLLRPGGLLLNEQQRMIIFTPPVL